MMKIVLATDGSPSAEHAARCLSEIPHREPIDLTVITSVYIPEVSANAASDAWLPAFKQEQYETVKRHFDHIAAMFSDVDARLRHKIGDGHVGQSITEQAEAVGADLIVLGAKGHSAVNRIMLGSVSDFVATHARCSVLVVRPEPDDSGDSVHVTVAHDGSTESDVTLDPFTQFNWDRSTDGHILNVLPVVRTFRQELFPKTASEDTEREKAMASIARATERLSQLGLSFELAVIEGEHVGESIVQFSEKHRSKLIVVGDHDRGPLGRLMLGSVSRYVLRHAQCSVWIARTEKK